MKAAALLSVLLGAASIDAGVTNVERRQEAKDMNQFAEWMAARGTCPVYITKTPPKNDRSMSICVEFCKKTDDGEYSSDLDGFYYIPSKCECSNPTVEAFTKEVFEVVAKGLSVLDNLLCTLVLKAIMTIVEEGISFIPVFRGFTTAVKAAKSFAENAGSALDLFQGWIEPVCGMPGAQKFDPADTFKQLVETPDEFGESIGCKRNKKKLCKKLPPANPKNKPTKKADGGPPKTTTKPKATPTKPKQTNTKPKQTNTKPKETNTRPRETNTKPTETKMDPKVPPKTKRAQPTNMV
ncbi:uncharacterized protein PG998_010219 [Apiospora kogelbergensis]|uniref:uncharacterized protein n=1 Tax=Apiospora kogelbergensis TaxID=1337665 RepID=UPI00312D04E0